MANAKTRDARAGFEIYVETGGSLTLDELNDRLGGAGYGKIAERTLNHYRNLLRVGSNRYIPINRFDVARASRAYENLSSLVRYRYRSTEIPVRTRFIKAQSLLDVSGLAVASGDVGVLIHFDDDSIKEVTNFKPNTGNIVVLEFGSSSKPILGIVVYCDLSSTPPLVEVEYTGLTSPPDFGTNSVISAEPVRFIVTSDTHDNNAIDIVGRRIYYFFELIEGVRTLLNKAGQDSDDVYYIPPPIVKELSFASPIQIVLEIPPILLPIIPCLIVGKLARQFIEIRRVWYQGSVDKAQGLLLSQALEKEKQEKEIVVETREVIRQILPKSQLSDDEIDRAVKEQILVALRGLVENGITNIEAQTHRQVVGSDNDVK